MSIKEKDGVVNCESEQESVENTLDTAKGLESYNLCMGVDYVKIIFVIAF